MTYTYKHLRDIQGNTGQYILRKEDKVQIPCAPGNRDYQQYLLWVEAGGVTEEADPLD